MTKQISVLSYLDNLPQTSNDYGLVHYRHQNGVKQQRVGFGDWEPVTDKEPKVVITPPAHNIDLAKPGTPHTPSQTGLKEKSLPKARRGGDGWNR